MHLSFRSISLTLALLLPMAVLLTGCGSAGTTVLVPAAGGREKIRVEFTRGSPGHAKADGFEVLFAGFINNTPPKTPDVGFTVSVKDAAPPRRIVVEDITDETPAQLLTDESPLVKNGVWHNAIVGIDPHDPRIEWLYHLNNDLRIYRLTVTAADGHVVVLDQASNYPGFIKAAIRTAFGEKL